MQAIGRSTGAFKYGLAALGGALTLWALGLANPAAVGAANPTAQVIVANTDNQPVPTEALGITTVDGSVSVTTLPDVTLAPGAHVAIGNVVRVDTAPVEPVRASAGTSYCYGWGGCFELYTVPAGRRLVIENISGWATLDPSLGPQLFLYAGMQVLAYPLLTKQGDEYSSTSQQYNVHYEGRLYAEAGETVVLKVAGGNGGYMMLSGYLVPVQ